MKLADWGRLEIVLAAEWERAGPSDTVDNRIGRGCTSDLQSRLVRHWAELSGSEHKFDLPESGHMLVTAHTIELERKIVPEWGFASLIVRRQR